MPSRACSRFVVVLAMIIGGCASTDAMRDGAGTKRVYRDSYESTFSAVLAAANANRLTVVESDGRAGRISLSHAGNWSNWGESVAVRVKPLTNDFTQVEIVSEPRFQFLNYSPDWARILLHGVDRELREPID